MSKAKALRVRTSAELFSRPQWQSELTKIGLVPRATDPTGPGRPRRDDKDAVPVAGRISSDLRRDLTYILERKVVPGVVTTSDAVFAAIYLWVNLILPRFKAGEMTNTHRLAGQIKDMYDREITRIRAHETAGTARAAIHLALQRSDTREAIERAGIAAQMMAAMDVEPAERFKRKLYGSLTGDDMPPEEQWRQDPVAVVWDEMLRGVHDEVLGSLDANDPEVDEEEDE